MCRLTIDHLVGALSIGAAAAASTSAPTAHPHAQPPADRIQLPREVLPSHYAVSIAPNLNTWTFDAKVTISCTARTSSNTITLNSLDITIHKAFYRPTGGNCDGIVVPVPAEKPVYNVDDHTVALRFPDRAFAPGESLELVIEYEGKIGDNMVGFYRSSYSHEGAERPLAVTQFEAVDCRRAIPCFDEPDLKAVFSISLVVDKHLTALANTEVVSDAPAPNDATKRVVHFAPTPKMSTYLLAFVVGEFDYVEAYTKPTAHLAKPVRCRVYTPLGQAHLGKFALDVCVRTLEYFSELFGIPYPLTKCDQIAIPDFSAGAMENWGLITYRTVSLLVDDASGSVESKKWVATTITHELAHQWFGNLVTFNFWDELWLNEGFATWVGTLGAAHLFPDWDMWAIFIAEEQKSAFAADGVRSSHPIQVPVRDAKEIAQIFDSISYNKGAAVIHMLTNWLGLDAFLAGIRAYLAKFAYANATTKDLYAALSAASGRDVAAFMTNWTGKVGYPYVSVSQMRDPADPSTLRLSLTQHRFLRTADVGDDDDRVLWNLPLDLAPIDSIASAINIAPNSPKLAIADSGIRKSDSSMTLVSASSSTCSLPSLADSFAGSNSTLSERSIDLDLSIDSDCCLINSHRGGFYRVAYDDKSFAVIAESLAAGKITSSATRMGIYNDAFALARGGVKSLPAFLALVRKALPRETQYSVFLDVSKSLADVRAVWAGQPDIVRQRLNALRVEVFGPLAAKVGFDHRSGESELDRLLRPLFIMNAGMSGIVPVVDEARRRFKALVNSSSSGTSTDAVASDMYAAVIAIAVANGDDVQIDDAIKLFESTTDIELRYAALSGLGHSRHVSAFSRVLDYSVSDKVRPQDIHYVWGSLGANPLARRAVYEFLMENWEMLAKRYASNFDVVGSLVSLATRSFTTPEELEMVRKGFAGKDVSGCFRKLEESYSEIASNIAWLKHDATRVAAWLEEAYGGGSKASSAPVKK